VNVERGEKSRNVLTMISPTLGARMNMFIALITITNNDTVFDRNCLVDVSVSIVRMFPAIPKSQINNPKYLNK